MWSCVVSKNGVAFKTHTRRTRTHRQVSSGLRLVRVRDDGDGVSTKVPVARGCFLCV